MMRSSCKLSAVFLFLIVIVGCGGDDNPIGSNPDPFLGCQTVGTVQVGSFINGQLTTSDCGTLTIVVDYYELNLTETKAITIEVVSEIDPLLALLDRETASVIASDGADESDSNARIVVTLSPDTYIIAVSTMLPGPLGEGLGLGPYALSLR